LRGRRGHARQRAGKNQPAHSAAQTQTRRRIPENSPACLGLFALVRILGAGRIGFLKRGREAFFLAVRGEFSDFLFGQLPPLASGFEFGDLHDIACRQANRHNQFLDLVHRSSPRTRTRRGGLSVVWERRRPSGRGCKAAIGGNPSASARWP
jgi:hypothetical protein